jgi:hypothetical protein
VQALLAIQPIDALVVIPDGVAAKQHEKTSIAPTSPHGSMLSQGGTHQRFIESVG